MGDKGDTIRSDDFVNDDVDVGTPSLPALSLSRESSRLSLESFTPVVPLVLAPPLAAVDYAVIDCCKVHALPDHEDGESDEDGGGGPGAAADDDGDDEDEDGDCDEEDDGDNYDEDVDDDGGGLMLMLRMLLPLLLLVVVMMMMMNGDEVIVMRYGDEEVW